MAMATGSSSPDRRPVSAFDLALDITRELRADGVLRQHANEDRARDTIETMVRKALRDGGIRP